MKQLRTLLFIFAFVFAVSEYSIALDEYWISFSGSPTRGEPHPAGGPWRLIKIDALGNVVIPPAIVVRNSSPYSVPQDAGAALSDNGKGRLNLWIPSRPRPAVHVTGYVFRAVIDKNSLKLLSFRQTGIMTVNGEHLQVTQSGPMHFLVTQILKLNPERSFYIGNALSPEGTLLGHRWLLTPGEASCYTCGMGVNSGGRVFFFTELGAGASPDKVMLQPLDESGHPNATPYEVAKAEHIYLHDLSGIVGDNKRYVLYSTGGARCCSLYLQAVDTRTRKPLDVKVPVAIRAATSLGQSAAIDPFGRFVVYIAFKFGQITSGDWLIFQALDATGHPSGEPKVIATGVGVGIDLLKD